MTDAQPIDVLLPLLHRVRRTSPERWLASCPCTAHESGDKHPSLGIRECSDGVVLLRCYSLGCDPRSIMQAVGLELKDLFPRRVSDLVRVRDGELTQWSGAGKPRVDRVPYRDALQILKLESTVIALAADHIVNGIAMSPDDVERVHVAASRIRDAVEWTGIRR